MSMSSGEWIRLAGGCKFIKKIEVLGRIIVRHKHDDDDDEDDDDGGGGGCCDDEHKISYSKPPPNHCGISCLSLMGTTTLVVI